MVWIWFKKKIYNTMVEIMNLLKYIKYRICILLVDKLWPKKDYSIILELNHNNKNGETFFTKLWDKCCEYSYKYEEEKYKI